MASDSPGSTAARVLPPGAAQSFLSIQSVRIFVRDLDRSLRFYLDQLGFRLVIDTRLQSGERWVAVSPPDGTAILALVAPPRGSAEHKLIGRATQVVLITADVAGRFQEWSRKGVRFSSTPRLRRIKYEPGAASAPKSPRLLGEEAPVWGGVFARFRDVDGNTFSLVSFDEVTHAVEAERRAAAGKLEAERRAAHELAIARQVQARLFPQSLPALRSLDYAGACLPARAVGGDYYDFLSLGPDRLGLVIGDVMGKGIAAALLMANLQANLRSQVAPSSPSTPTGPRKPSTTRGRSSAKRVSSTPSAATATALPKPCSRRSWTRCAPSALTSSRTTSPSSWPGAGAVPGPPTRSAPQGRTGA